MVYTVTCNPSLDYILKVNNFRQGTLNRSMEEKIFPGGKGINVSIVLTHLQVDNVAMGFLAGFSGKEIERQLVQLGCRTDFIQMKEGFSRINVKMKGEEETEVNGSGPVITLPYQEELKKRLSLVKQDDILVLSGKKASGLPDDTYENILDLVSKNGCKIVIDTSGPELKRVLKYRPFLVKPNHHELGEIFNTKIESVEEAAEYASQMQILGARNVMVSMAEKGALLLDEDGKFYESSAPKGIVLNSVGAGDSMVAGFLCGYIRGESNQSALHMGIAAGSASAFSYGLATEPEIDSLLEKMK